MEDSYESQKPMNPGICDLRMDGGSLGFMKIGTQAIHRHEGTVLRVSPQHRRSMVEPPTDRLRANVSLKVDQKLMERRTHRLCPFSTDIFLFPPPLSSPPLGLAL